MPSISLPTVSGTDVKEIVNAIERQRKEMEFLLANLDDDNIKSLKAKKIQVGTSTLEVSLQGISLDVQGLETEISLKATASDVTSQFNVQAGLISSKVEKTDYTGQSIMSLIEQTPEEIKLSANKIELSGITKVYRELQIGESTEVNPVLKFGAYNTWLTQGASSFTVSADNNLHLYAPGILTLTGINKIDMNSETVQMRGSTVDFTNAVVDCTGAYFTNLYAVFG